MGVKGIRLSKSKRRRSNTPNKIYSNVLWKTQKKQNKKLQNGNLVALKRSSASKVPIKIFSLKSFYGYPSTTVSGEDANIEPKHLSFLIGGTGKILTAT
ncbi:MAG: hypothetical protein KME21_27190 [Desmonostoc vinosum HA7617-LM4]|jgi:hypothetical protein|nr:hypothetical protein [Desmonostoc vinosum HA7617-LM4]